MAMRNDGWLHAMHTVMTLLLIFLFISPFFVLFMIGFSQGWRWPNVWPETFTLRAWNYIFFENTVTWTAIWNSARIAFIVSIIDLLLAMPAASVLGRMAFKGKLFFEAIIFAPLIIPPFISIMGLHLIFLKLSLTDSLTGVVIAHIIPTLPYMIRALVISYSTLGNPFEQQAQILGAGVIQRFYYIVLPLLLPGVVAGVSLTVLISLSQYILTFLVAGSQMPTLPILLFPFINGGDQTIGGAYSVLFLSLALAFLILLNGLLKRYYGKKMMIYV